MASEKLGKDAEAIRDFQAALDLPGIEEPEQVLLLETLAEHSLRQQQYAAALEKLRRLAEYRKDFRVFFRQGLALEKLGELPQAEAAYRQSLSAAADNAEQAAAARALAVVARKREDWASARQLLQVAHAAEPQDRQTLWDLAQLSYASRDYAEAVRWQRQAMALKATAEDQKFLVNLLVLIQDREGAAQELEALLPRLASPQEQEQAGLQLGSLYLEMGDLAKAANAFRRAVEIRGSADAQLAFARVLAMQGRAADAVQPLKNAVRQQPTAANHFELGMLLARTGSRKEAVEQLERAVALGLAPAAAGQAYEQLGHLYLGLGQYRKSRKALLAARQAHGDSPAIAFALGDNSILLGEYDRAIAEIEAGLAQRESRPARMALALAYEKSDKGERASRIYESLLRQAPAGSREAQEIIVRLANLKFAQGDPQRAATLFASAYQASGGAQSPLLLQAGQSLLAAGSWPEAREVFEKLHRKKDLSGRARLQVLQSLGQIYSELGEPRQAEKAWSEALAQPGLTPADRGGLLLNLGFLHRQWGDNRTAAEYFSQAIRGGSDTAEVRKNLGLALFDLQQWQEALEQFQAAQEQRPGPVNLLYMGRAYKELNKPGLALHYMSQAEAGLGEFSTAEQHTFLAELGYLYASQGETEQAVRAYAEALALGDDPDVTLALASLRRTAGDTAGALALLAAMNPAAMTAEQDLRRLDETALALAARGDYPGAIEAQQTAATAAPTPDRYQQLGDFTRRAGRRAEAVRYYLLAAEAGDNLAYRKSLGYALAEAGSHTEAAAVFAEVLAQSPEDDQITRDLGYTYLRVPDNEQAVTWFKKAIDQRLEVLASSGAGGTDDPEVARLRQEVSRLTRRFGLTAYLTYTSDRTVQLNPLGGVAGEITRSNSGLEFSYLPPKIGFRDERIFQVIARLVGNLEPRSLRFDEDSFQGAIGIRYKPLRRQNFHLGLERLVKIGDQAQDNWLLRAMYSWGRGEDLRAGERAANYTYLYAEADYFVESPHGWMWYGEARQGLTFNWPGKLLLTPHLFVDGQFWEPQRLDGSFVEGGPGLSWKYRFNADRYHAPRSRTELLLQYRVGKFIGSTSEADDKRFDGLFLTFIFQY
jgi:tetratricopeptide (TPR) repeat protein